MPSYGFGRVSFGPMISDWVPQVDPGELFSSERHVPYSDYNVIDVGGRGPKKWKARVRIRPDDVQWIEPLLGKTAALTVNGVTYAKALMTALSNHQVSPLGEWHAYDAEFTIVQEVRGPI